MDGDDVEMNAYKEYGSQQYADKGRRKSRKNLWPRGWNR